MIEVTDTVHGFKKRPHYTEVELDTECQDIIFTFLRKKYNKVEFPISTEDLKTLIEEFTNDLDLYTKFEQKEGEKIEGVTLFTKNEKPSVCISEDLTLRENYENRLRTTLAHELGHVIFHNFIIQIKGKFEQECRRENILNLAKKDWMEWQASYASGAFLMPFAHLNIFVRSIKSETREEIIRRVALEYKVSQDAARVRLEQKKLIQ
jgi:Zn-dependent peptidase ImmA (M78 family)